VVASREYQRIASLEPMDALFYGFGEGKPSSRVVPIRYLLIGYVDTAMVVTIPMEEKQ
jgi:hypothetical protein